MTIGSPIDKHLILWPSIWDAFNKPGLPVSPPIRWRNYYDHGDPIGFDLDTAREWMGDPDHFWKPAFEFRKQDDFGLSRHMLPGAAHNDYWEDEVVSGHFIETVVGAQSKDGRTFAAQNWDRTWAKIISYVSPYLLALVLLYTGTYRLVKALDAYAPPMVSLGETILVATVITYLLAGTTIAARIPRLTRKLGLRLLAAALFVLFAAPYVLLVDARTRCWLGFATASWM